LETRLLVCDDAGGAYGVTYKWRTDNSDADLLETNLTEDIAIETTTGTRMQPWYYPSRADCLTCHTANAGLVLGVKTRQLNRDVKYPDGKTENQLVALEKLGLLDADFSAADVKNFPRLARWDDATRSLEDRARSYLDANCANCHRPDGTVASFDARYDTPLVEQKIVDGHVLIDQRIDGARVIAPNDVWRSILLMRVDTAEGYKMPPLARNTVDAHGVKLLRDWIINLPGPHVLPPPEILPPGGNFSSPVKVSLASEPGAKIYYTLDGTVPTADDLPYEKPFTLTEPTIVRATAFKPGSTKSVAAKEFFLFDKR
jgi:mono/diheme cytochrome c family protein